MKYLNKVVEVILEVLVAGMVLGCCWQVITRFLLHNPSKYTEEVIKIYAHLAYNDGSSICIWKEQPSGY